MNVIKPNLIFKEPLTPLNLDGVFFLVVHHIEATSATIEDIHRWHLDKGWDGCGYNEYIRKDGTVYIGRGDNIGAHCLGHNQDGYGIALEGDYMKEYIPIPQYNALIERLKYHKSRLKNLKSICGHRDLMSTDCPGKNIIMSTILSDVEKGNNVDNRSDIDKAVDNAFRKGKITNKEYWTNVLNGTELLNREWLRLVFLRI